MKGPLVLMTTGLARGGAEAQVVLLAVAMRERGWRVHVVSMLEPRAFGRELAEAGVAVHSLGMEAGRLAGLARLAVILRRVRPLVLHCHLFHANLLGRLARMVFPVPVVLSTLHSMAESGRESADVRWRDRAYRWTDGLARWTVAVCAAVGERHVAAGAVRPEPLRVVPNGVDSRVYCPDGAARSRLRHELGLGDEFVWLAAGRLMWKKDYQTMLRAASRVPGCVLWIAGAGPQEAELRAMAGELGVEARWLGERADLPALMNAADGLVLSSVVEGLPMVLLEAAACGLPAVSTRAGGASEIVVEGETGFLVECGDEAGLAAAMKRLRGLSAAAREEMGRAARTRAVERFDVTAAVSQWEQLYEEL